MNGERTRLRLETDGAGAVTYRDFWPYGEEATPPVGGERMKFTGHERDLGVLGSNVDDLDYMHARYYRPLVGRFLSMDSFAGTPGVPLSWNRYSYVLGKPVSLVDPTGHFGESLMINFLVWANAFTVFDSINVSSSEGATYNFFSGQWGLDSLARGIGTEIASGESKDPFFRLNRYYERRHQKMVAEGNYTAAVIDEIALAIIPDNAEAAGNDVALAAAFPPEMLGKPAISFIRASLQRSPSFRSEIARLSVGEVITLSKKAGPLKKAAQRILKLIKEEKRLME